MKDKKIYICLTVIFFLAAIAMTYPLILKMGTHIPGWGNTNEPYSIMWHYWWFKYAHQNGLDFANCKFMAYPFGYYLGNIAGSSYVWENTVNLLTMATSHILAYNILVLLSFFLTLVFTYMLAHDLTKSIPASIFSAFIFAFCPYHFARAWQHLSLAQTEWIPLYTMALLRLKDKFGRKDILLASASLFLAVSFNPYYGYFLAVVTAVYMFYVWARNRALAYGLRLAGRITAVFIIAAIFLSPMFVDVYRIRDRYKNTPEQFNILRRPFEDLFTQSAKPLSFLLPAPAHPIFGKFTERFIGSPLYGVSYTEHALYLGWIPLILAFMSFRYWRRKRKLNALRSALCADENFSVGFFIWLAIAAWLFSQPPYFSFPYFKIYMPSFFMYKMLPMFRAYCRFGIIVMFAVSILAGFGLKILLDRIRTMRAKVFTACLFTGLVLFEFLNFPPFKVIDLTRYPAVYDWLKTQKGDFVIAEYPLDADSPNEYYRFCQIIHKKKMVNGTVSGTEANQQAKTMWKLTAPATQAKLKKMGVKYVLIHLDAYEGLNDEESAAELDIIRTRKIAGLRYIGSFDKVDVYGIE
jgi:hypothetical protein